MPISGSRRPPAPTCEDCWDEDTQTSTFDPRASAKRSQSADFDLKSSVDKKSHDGSDSGYSSKAGTSDDMSTTSINKGIDSKMNPDPVERERQPYSYAPPRTEDPRASSPTKTKTAKMGKPPKQAPFRHPYGVCWVCDRYEYHFDPEKDVPRPASVNPALSQKAVKTTEPKARSKEDGDVRPSSSRRSSSSSKRDSRPVSMYGVLDLYGFPPLMTEYTQPMHAHGWQPTSHPMPQYNHYQYPYAPLAPITTGGHHPPGFFDVSPMQYHHPPEPFYAEPGRDESGSKQRSSKRDSSSQRTTSRASRDRSSTKTKSSAEADRISMPPPPKPESARPLPRKSPTEYPYSASKRHSVFIDDDDTQEVQTLVSKERTSSGSKPPSSYKPPAGAEIQSRPRTRKSQSYSDPSVTTYVASSRDIPRRRTDPYEQKVAEAEHYVAKTNKLREIETAPQLGRNRKQKEVEFEDYDTEAKARENGDYEAFVAHLKSGRRGSESDEIVAQMRSNQEMEPENYPPRANRLSMKPSLTAETLKIMEKQTTSSESGSVRSKHSSRDSAIGRARAATAVTNSSRMMNITTDDGIVLSIPANLGDIPLDIVLGNIRISNPNRDDSGYRDLKRIERAPSEISHTSRRSLNTDSVVSAPKGREEQPTSSRQNTSSYSSKRSSRAPSTSRTDKREVRSIDYSLLEPESYYLEYGT